MADGTFHITLSKDTSYGTRNNIKYPGSAAAATASGVNGVARVNDVLPSGVTIAGLSTTSDGE